MTVRQVHQPSHALHNAAAKNGSSRAAGPNAKQFNELMARQIGQASAWEGGRRQPLAMPGVRQHDGNGAMPPPSFAPTFRIIQGTTVEDIDITADVETDKEATTDEMVDGLQDGKTIAEIAEELGVTEEEVIEGLEAEGYTVNKIDEGTIQGMEIVDSDGNVVAEYWRDDKHSVSQERWIGTYVYFIDADGNEISRTTYSDGTVVEIDHEGRETEVEPVGDVEHEVKEGENLYVIAALYGKSLAELAESNPELFENPRDPDLIYAGETVIIEDGSKTTVAFNDQTLTTYPDGSVELTLADGTVIEIEPGSVEEDLAHVLLSANPQSSDPEKAKEGEVVTTVIMGLLAGKTYQALSDEAAAKGEDVQSALDTYGLGPEVIQEGADPDGRGNQVPGLFGDPPAEETPSGIWVPVRGEDGKWYWADQQVALAMAAENVASAKLDALPAAFDEGQAQLDVWALDSDYDQAMSDAGNTLNEALSPHGLSWAGPAPGGTLAEAESRLGEASADLELAEGALQAYEEAAGLIGGTFTDTNQVDAIYYEIEAQRTKGDKLSTDYTVKQIEEKRDTYEKGSEEYKYFDGELEKAKDVQDALESQLEVVLAYADYYKAKGNLHSANALATELVDEYLIQNPMPSDPDWNHIAGNGAILGKLNGKETIVDEDGQLWLVLHYEYDDVKVQLTFDMCDQSTPRGVSDSKLNQQWQEIRPDVLDLKEIELVEGKEGYEALEEQLDVRLDDSGVVMEELQEEFEELYADHLDSGGVEPPDGELVEITVAGQTVLVPEEVAKAYEETGIEAISDLGQPVCIEIDGEQVWVDAKLAVAKIALDAAREEHRQLEDAMETVKAAIDYYSFQLDQPISPLDSATEIKSMQAAYLEQHEQEMRDGFFQPQFQALFSEYGNEFRSLNKDGIAEALQIDPSTEYGQETVEVVSEKIRDIGGDMKEVRIVPLFHVEEAVGIRMTALFAVKDADGKTWYVDESGMDFENMQDFLDNNALFSPDAKLVLPADLRMLQDDSGDIKLDVVAALNVSETQTAVDTSVSIVTGVAASLSFIPVLAPFTLPVAAAGGAYLGGRALYDQVNYLNHGGDFFDSRSLTNLASVAATVLPIGAIGLRWAGTAKNLSNLSKGEVYLASMGAMRSTSSSTRVGSFLATPNAEAIGSYLRTAGGWSRTARMFDYTATAVGAPLMADNAKNLILNWDQMSELELADAIAGFASGFVGVALGARGGLSNRPGRQSSVGWDAVPGNLLPTDVLPAPLDGTTTVPNFGDGNPNGGLNGSPDPVATAQRSAAETAALSSAVDRARGKQEEEVRAVKALDDELTGLNRGLKSTKKRLERLDNAETTEMAAEKKKLAEKAARLTREIADADIRFDEAKKVENKAKEAFVNAESARFEGRVREILRWSMPEFAGETRFLNGTPIDRDPSRVHGRPDGYLEMQWSSCRPTNFIALEVKNFAKYNPRRITELVDQINKSHPHIETEGRHVRYAAIFPAEMVRNETTRMQIATKINSATGGKVDVEDVFFLTDHGDTAHLESAVPIPGPDGEQRYRMETETLRQPFLVVDKQPDGPLSAQNNPDSPDTSHISTLSPAEVAALSKKELGSYSVWEVEALTRQHIESMSPGQLSALAPGQFRKFTPEQVAWMTPEQLDALSVAQLRPFQRTHGKTMTADQKATVDLALSFARMREYQQRIDVLASMFNTSHSWFVMMPDWITGPATAGAYVIRTIVFNTQSLLPNATAADTKLGRTLNLSSGVSFMASSPGTWVSTLRGPDHVGNFLFMLGNLIYGPASIRKGFSGGPVDRFLGDHAGNAAYLAGSGFSTAYAFSSGSSLGAASGMLFALGSVGFWASAFRADRVNGKPVPRTDAEIAKAARSDAGWAMADRVSLGAGFGIGMGLTAVDKIVSLIAEDAETGAGDPVEQIEESDQEAEIGEGEPPRTSAPGRYNPILEQEGYLWVDAMDGDSVRAIATAHLADVVETVMLNMDHILRPDLIQPGDRIYLPANA